MKKTRIAIVVMLCLLISGCAANGGSADLFSYKNTKIGDNSKVGAIVRLLPGQQQFEGMELQTESEPYELKLFYETADGAVTDEMMMHNAAALFALVPNADIVTITVDGTPHTAKRGVMEDWYGQPLVNVQTENELKELEDAHPANAGEMSMIFE